MKIISISIFAFFIITLSSIKCFCQLKAISIGETCPDVVLSHIINFKTDQIKMSDLKGKLVILDFWATWCAPCVAMISATDSLQKEFGGKIQILPVTDQDAATVTAFLNNIKRDKNISMPSVTGDKQLQGLFPHVEIPHYVWLDENSKVIAITGAEQIKANVISNFLSKKETALPVKADTFKTIDEAKPMFVTGNELVVGAKSKFEKLNNSDVLYHSVITKYIDGFGCEQATDSEKITCKNTAIGDLYRMAASHYNLINLSYNSTIWETNNPEIKKMTDSASTIHATSRVEINNWMNQYTYCYELKFPSQLKDKKYDLMLEDLNDYFGTIYNIVGSMELRRVKCLVLTETPKKVLPNTSASKNNYTLDQYHLQLRNASIGELVKLLSINLDTLPPLVDETHNDVKLDFDLNCNMSDINAVNNALATYGLQLVEKVTERNMIVIKDRPLN